MAPGQGQGNFIWSWIRKYGRTNRPNKEFRRKNTNMEDVGHFIKRIIKTLFNLDFIYLYFKNDLEWNIYFVKSKTFPAHFFSGSNGLPYFVFVFINVWNLDLLLFLTSTPCLSWNTQIWETSSVTQDHESERLRTRGNITTSCSSACTSCRSDCTSCSPITSSCSQSSSRDAFRCVCWRSFPRRSLVWAFWATSRSCSRRSARCLSSSASCH